MKALLLCSVIALISLGTYSCSGECMRCQKAGAQTINYCENDFPSNSAYHNQINGLDSLGYTCTKK